MNQGGIIPSRGEMKARLLEERVSALETKVAELSTSTNTTKVQICPKCVGTGIDGHGEDEVEGGCKECKGSGKL